MFERLGSLTYRFRFAIVAAWAVAAAWCAVYGPSLAAQGMTDQTAFLPAGTSSMLAHDALEREFPGSTSVTSAVVSFSRDGGLVDVDRAYITATERWIRTEAPETLRESVSSIDTVDSRPELEKMLRSDDGELEMLTVNLSVAMVGGEGDVVVSSLRDHFASTAPAGLDVHVTGAAGIGSDYLAAIIAGTDSTTAVTVVLVILILLLIYRAPLAAMVPLVTIGAAYMVARGVLGILALAGWQVSSLIDTFIVVLIFGVGTDYAIFLISRYREEVSRSDWHSATRVTVSRIGAVISASAATVIVGLSAMAFGEFGMIQTTGPALAVAIFVTLVAGLTLTPALLGIFGHYLFWPLHARTEPEGEPGGLFARLAQGVSRRPGIVTLVLLVALVVPAGQITQMRTNFDVLAELPTQSDARAGFDEISDHLGRGNVFQSAGVVDGGAGMDFLQPATLARFRDLMREITATPGVTGATSLLTPDGDGVVPDAFQPSKQLGTMAGEFSDDGGGQATDTKSLTDPDVTDGLDTAISYIEGLGRAFPDVASGAAFRAVRDDLSTARDQVVRARDGAVVSAQLRTLSDAMTSPAAAGGGSEDTSVAVMGDYLDELAAEYPVVRGLAAFKDATKAAASLEKEVSIAAALDLSSAFDSLATWFEDNRSDATLFPESLSGTSEAKRLRREIEATFDAIPVDLEAMAPAFAGRRDDLYVPTGLGGEEGKDLDDAVAAFISEDRSAIRFYVTTSDDPYAQSAFQTVRDVQVRLAAAAPAFGQGAGAYLGGTTAQFADVQTVMGRDFERVGLITVLGILVVLMLLLRAIVAPLYLVATVLLSCATALGLSSWFFESVLGQPGVSFYLPILVFVLLVALGSDYNIFLMSRVREESASRSIHDGIRIASGRTGAVITSAGLILAGTFGSMATAPLAVLLQVGLTVAVGVLIDTFVVRSILVPAITTLADKRAWWPSGAGLGALRVGWPVVISIPADGVAAAGVAAEAGLPRRRLGAALALSVLVPVAVAGLLTWSVSSSTANLARVTAAVVDQDAGATATSADGTSELLRLGDDLAGGLVAGGSTDAFTWVAAVDPVDARDGLADGRFGAVLTIPSDFSQTIASVRAAAAGGAAGGTHPAKLQLVTNDATSYLLGSIARSISDTIALSAAERVTAAYVDDVLLSVTTAQGRVAGSAADADRIATGSTDLATGATTVSSVAGEFVGGLEEMAASTSDASAGFDKLAAGIDQLAIGTRKIATGASKLGKGADAAADGAGELAGGVDELAGGLDGLAARTTGLPEQAQQLADGAKGVSDGVDATAGGLALLNAALLPLETLATATDGAATDAATRMAAVADRAAKRAAEAGQLAADAGSVAAGVADLTGRITSLSADCVGLGGTDELCSRLAAIAGDGPSLADAGTALAGDADTLANRAGNLAVDAGEASGYAGALPGMTAQLEAGIQEAAAGAGELEDGITKPQAPGIPSLKDAAALVKLGTDELARGMPELTKGISRAATGAGLLADGASTLSGGMTTLAIGMDSLASGAALTADGAAKIAGGTSAAADGATELAAAVDDVVDAGRLVQAEADNLADDGQSVADDAETLASALEKDAAAIPAWSAEDRETVGGVIASPVDIEATRLNAVPTTAGGLAPFFMALALWVGALAAWLVVPALPRGNGTRRWWARPAVAFALCGAIGIVQALVMIAGLRYGLGIEIARLPELLAFAALVVLGAVAVVQTLVALFGTRGWFVALFLVVLQLTAAGAWLPVETAPGFLQALHPLLPMTHAVEGFRALIAGGGPSLAPAVVVVSVWMVGALAVTWLAARFRTGRPSPEPALAPA